MSDYAIKPEFIKDKYLAFLYKLRISGEIDRGQSPGILKQKYPELTVEQSFAVFDWWSQKELLGYAHKLGSAQSKVDKQAAELTHTQNWMHLTDKANQLQLSDEEIQQLKAEYLRGYALLPKD